MIKISDLKTELQNVMRLEAHVDRAKAYRGVLLSAVQYLYEKKDKAVPEKASLLELIDSDVVCDFVCDGDVINSLHYVRILGMNAEHDNKIKKGEEKLACDNISYFVGLIVANEDGERAKYQKPPYMSEATTRKLYIDLYLREAGWDVLEQENLAIAEKAGVEIKVEGMPNGQGIGFCDYVLYGRDGKPLAIVEAKRTSRAPEEGRHQVDLYGDCMEKVYGYKPVLYYTNGYVIKVMDGFYPDREVMAFHTIDELELMIQRRNRKNIDIKIDESIAGRPYQQMAITNICEWFNTKHRRGLLVMATGTGKTRVSIALVDVLTRNRWVKNVLFLADRTSLVHQAKENFARHLPNMSVCELSGSGEKDLNARLMFCTYQTMINYIDAEDKKFSSGRFDLIIIDEAHRSIFNKYGSIFSYFDSLLVGLTATPKSEVDANTYRIFGCESEVPNFDYSLEEAVKDEYLVNYKSFSRTTKLLKRGIKWNDLTDDEKKQLEEYFDDGAVPTPDFTVSEKELFKRIYNKDTCNEILEELMQFGIKTNGGEKLGKSIIFAYNHHHAQMIVDCFHALYPDYGRNYCQLIDNTVSYADDLIIKFEKDDEFRIAVSVDMLDTGIDVPAVVNLVFFKPVKSKIKFVQMIGRGTRLCPNLFGEGKHKTHFVIFDYCGNFEYFGENPEGTTGVQALSLSQRLFEVRLDILHELQRIEYQEDEFAYNYYLKLKDALFEEVNKIKGHSNRIQVRAEMQYVDKYTDYEEWACLSPLMVKEVKRHITPLLDSGIKGKDLTIAFDIRMLDVELSLLLQGNTGQAQRDVKTIREVAQYLLNEKASIPQVLEKAEQLRVLVSEQFWMAPTVEKLEKLREDVRDLMQFLTGGPNKPIDVDIDDITEPSGDGTGGGIIDIRTYREKVIDYLLEHSNNEVVRKIQRLEPIDANDLKVLEKILWEELGTKEEYEETTDIDNLAVFVRSIIGLSQEAINEKFGEFLSGNILNAQQQEFVKTIINYVRENGDISREDLLDKAPFDNYNIITLFGEKVESVIKIISILHDSINVVA